MITSHYSNGIHDLLHNNLSLFNSKTRLLIHYKKLPTSNLKVWTKRLIKQTEQFSEQKKKKKKKKNTTTHSSYCNSNYACA